MTNTAHKLEQHRIESPTNESYAGIPIYTAPGTHAEVFTHIKRRHSTGRVLELGTGGGAFSQRLADAGFDVISSDLSKTGFKANTTFVAADLNGPFSKQFVPTEFDIVVAVEVVEHLENLQHFLREVRALLTPAGSLWMTFPNLYLYSVLPALLRHGELVHWSRPQYHETGHQQIIVDWLVELLCEKHGLRVHQKMFINPVNFRRAYPGLGKRMLAELSLLAQTALTRFRSRRMCMAESVLLEIRHA